MNVQLILNRIFIEDIWMILFYCQATPFLAYLNSQHPNINFTAEYEIDFKLTFLDTLIFKTNNQFHSIVYRESTFSGLGMSCLLYTSPSPRDKRQSRMPSSA